MKDRAEDCRALRSILEHGRLDRFLRHLANAFRVRFLLRDVEGDVALYVQPEALPEGQPAPQLPAMIDLEYDGKRLGRLYVEPWDNPLDEPLLRQIQDLIQERVAYELENEREKDSLSDEIISAYQELNLWYNLGDSVSNVTDPDAVCEYIAGQVVQILRCRTAGIYLLQEGSQLIKLHTSVGRTPMPQEVDGVPVNNSAFRLVATRGETLAIRNGEELTGIERELGAAWPMPLLAVPMRARGEITGVLVAAGEVEGEKRSGSSSGLFASGKRRLLSALGSQAAVLLQNARLYGELRELFYNTVRALADAVDAKDSYTHGHSRRVAAYAMAVAKRLNLPPEQIANLELAGLLHDVGKIGVPEWILNKPGKLSDEEFEMMRQHVVRGAQIVANVDAMIPLVPAILHHHERYDGRGYPNGLSGEDIPLLGRILAVADAFDAMTSDRPYRPAMTIDQAITELKRNRGTQFDPRVVDAMLDYVESVDFAYDRTLDAVETSGAKGAKALPEEPGRYLTRLELGDPWTVPK